MPLPPGFQLEGAQSQPQMPPKLPYGFQLEGASPIAKVKTRADYEALSPEQKEEFAQFQIRDAKERGFGAGIPQAAYDVGGKVVDVSTRMGASPETAAKLGYATNVLTQAVPALFQGRVAQGAITPVMQAGGQSLMKSALKPPLAAQESGDAARAIDTMLREGYNPTMGAVRSMNTRIGELGKEIEGALAASPESVAKAAVGQRLLSTYNRFKSQVNPQADLAALRAAWDEFKNHPDLIGKTQIPVQLAQRLKQGTYAQLGSKAYGEIGSASTEAQKQLARGLKETIGEKVPAVLAPLETQSALVNARELALRRALMSGNRNILSLAPLASSTEGAIGFLADKSDLVKSLLARFLYSNARGVGTAVGAAPAVGNAALAARLREEE